MLFRFRVALRLGFRNCWFVLGTDVAALDPQRTRSINADEDAGARDLIRIICDRPFVERRKSHLDLSQALIDLFGEVVDFSVVLLETVVLGPQGFHCCNLLVAHCDGLA
jgi:hypothetical protein